MQAKTERSELTQAAIVEVALEMAALEGLESLSIGEVAKRLNLSKSGVFSRVGSREALQRAVLAEFDRRFQADIIAPALLEPRGLARLDAMVKAWTARATRPGSRGSCLYTAGAFEFDDRDGPLRDLLLDGLQRWRGALKRTLIQALDAGQLRADVDIAQLAFEINGLFTALVLEARFIRNPEAETRGWRAYRNLLAPYLI
ncbi:TetR/AcrR family transcriptional regulator [Roseateles oligotrophus]|uniref:TetR/AcrR family transcriptional regulator n=1 Tax=Roseateles oligotrophus TaxID=1769250 RepID=A0ABT2YKP5_9BURK|nr:TetR/AcrR family transcriptional regulator [Roseateles oligotrophus]MCV2370631.1 TetR/AcrR family transcriptional regulator [Roseateles oligotrophus]